MPKLHPERLFVLRTVKGLTQEGLAEMARLSDRQIRRLENLEVAEAPRTNDVHSSQEQTARSLAEALGTNLRVIAGEVPLPESVLTLAETLEIVPDVLKLAEASLVGRDGLIGDLSSPEAATGRVDLPGNRKLDHSTSSSADRTRKSTSNDPATRGEAAPLSLAQWLDSLIAALRMPIRTMGASLTGLASGSRPGRFGPTSGVLAAAGSMAVGIALAFAVILMDSDVAAPPEERRDGSTSSGVSRTSTEFASRARTDASESGVGSPLPLEPEAGVGPRRQTPDPVLRLPSEVARRTPEFLAGIGHALFTPNGEGESAGLADDDLSDLATWMVVAEELLDSGESARALVVTNMLRRNAGDTPAILDLEERVISNLVEEIRAKSRGVRPDMKYARSALREAEQLVAAVGERPGLWLAKAKAFCDARRLLVGDGGPRAVVAGIARVTSGSRMYSVRSFASKPSHRAEQAFLR